jgi:hypothetical protein
MPGTVSTTSKSTKVFVAEINLRFGGPASRFRDEVSLCEIAESLSERLFLTHTFCNGRNR